MLPGFFQLLEAPSSTYKAHPPCVCCHNSFPPSASMDTSSPLARPSVPVIIAVMAPIIPVLS